MLHSKFILLYKTLSASEIRWFKKWVYSPMHNQHEAVQRLVEFVETRRSLSEVTLQWERVFQYLYPREKFDLPRLRHVVSLATDVLEQFIGYYLSVDSLNAPLFWRTKAYRLRGLKKYAYQELEQAQAALAAQPLRNVDYYQQQYALDYEQFQLDSAGNRPQVTNLQRLADDGAAVFVLQTLQHACMAITHQNLYKTHYDIPFLEAVLQALEQGKYGDMPAVQLYYSGYIALTKTQEKSNFQQLKQGLEQYGQSVDRQEYRELYTIALNYCIKRLNTGEMDFVRQAFDLYQKGIETGILRDEQGQITRFAYLNTVSLGLRLSEYPRVEQFIEQAAAWLPEAQRENYRHFCRAKAHFAQKRYDQAQRLLVQVEYDDLFLNLDSKTMLLKIYMEEKSYEALYALIKSVSVFLQRKSVLSYHRENYKNILHFIKKILDGKTDKQAVRQQIEQTHPLTERSWLLSLL